MLIATSGTTGAPKAVMQTHRTYALTAEAFPRWLGLTSADRLLATLPFFHINAQAYSTMGALACGSLAILRRFSASRFWEEARALGATQFNSVGAMLHILLRTEPRPAEREHAIRSCYAALALPEATHRAFEERFGLSMSRRLSECPRPRSARSGRVGEPPRYGTMGRLRQHPRLGEINRARVVRDDGSDAAGRRERRALAPEPRNDGAATGAIARRPARRSRAVGSTRETSFDAIATATSRSCRARRT